MKFRTSLAQTPFAFQINHKDSILLVGSCFAENIGEKLSKHKFDCSINPVGISYNPISIFSLLGRKETLNDSDLLEKEGIYFNEQFHSTFNSISKEEVLNNINKSLIQKETSLKKANYLIISLGTAWVYEKMEDGNIVNNCHKQDAKLFHKRLLSIEEIVKAWEEFSIKLKEINPTLNILFTVSPIRHLRDGFSNNQLSKSSLLLAVNEICKTNSACHYFPSYELLMDDLRDYRFYAKDLLHPNEMAIDYIWEVFSKWSFSEKTQELNKKLESLQQSISHRAFHPNSSAHQKFLLGLIKELEEIQENLSLNFNSEIATLKALVLPQ